MGPGLNYHEQSKPLLLKLLANDLLRLIII